MGLTQKEANSLFYEEEGVLYWKKKLDLSGKVLNTRYADKEAGSFDKNGYRRVKYHKDCASIGTHRIIFLMYHGYLPDIVDHINGNPSDNMINNLREASHQTNNQNTRISCHNTSGYKGVNFHKPSKRWRCSMSFNNKTRQVWGFDSKEDAADFMQLWREMAHGAFANHG